MQGSRIKLQSDDGKNENGEHNQESDLHKWSQGLKDGLEYNLKTWKGDTKLLFFSTRIQMEKKKREGK